MRDKEKDISLINATGMPQPLKRIKRCHKHDTQHIILDDGFVRANFNCRERQPQRMWRLMCSLNQWQWNRKKSPWWSQNKISKGYSLRGNSDFRMLEESWEGQRQDLGLRLSTLVRSMKRNISKLRIKNSWERNAKLAQGRLWISLKRDTIDRLERLPR